MYIEYIEYKGNISNKLNEIIEKTPNQVTIMLSVLLEKNAEPKVVSMGFNKFKVLSNRNYLIIRYRVYGDCNKVSIKDIKEASGKTPEKAADILQKALGSNTSIKAIYWELISPKTVWER